MNTNLYQKKLFQNNKLKISKQDKNYLELKYMFSETLYPDYTGFLKGIRVTNIETNDYIIFSINPKDKKKNNILY